MDSRRKHERKRAAALTLAIALVAFGVVSLASLISGEPLQLVDPDAGPTVAEGEDPTSTLLVLGTKTNENDQARMVWLSLLSLNEKAGRGSVIYIPAHTAVEVPGRGLQGLDDAWATGGVPLVLVSVENVLGIQIDGYLEMSDNDALVTFEETGPLSVDVPEEVRVPAGRNLVRLLLSTGRQRLAPSFLVDLLYIVGVDGDDIDLGSRHMAFWDALLGANHEEPKKLGRTVRSAAGALAASDTSPNAIGELLAGLSALSKGDRPVRTLPVTPLEVPGNRLYAADEAEVNAFIAEIVGEEVAEGDEIRVQILNGNGVPGIGQEVADLLVGQGFRVILSGNAPRLNYKTTKIVTYDSSASGQNLARRAQELLKVGEVQVSGQEQGIVDLTIVIGKDFLRVR